MADKNILPQEHDPAVKGPKALFWYLTLFFTLGITAFSTGGLWFQFINNWFSKEVLYGQVIQSFSQSVLKGQIAALIVATPIFFVLIMLIRRALQKKTLAADNKVRLWITYIILFVVVAVAVGDLISALFSLLNGDFTIRFLLKSLVILIIVSWIFVYYWLEIRSLRTLLNSKIPKIMGIASLVVIIGSLVGSFFVIESPMQARKNAYDQTRINNLQEIKYAVDNYYQEFKKVPASFEELKTVQGYITTIDPKTGNSYEYRVVSSDSFELCAEFDNSNKVKQDGNNTYPVYNDFLHDAGRQCFTRKVNLPLDVSKTGAIPVVPVPVQ